MNCANCGEPVESVDRRATKAWCSDRCYRVESASERRESGQVGLDQYNE